MKLMVARVSSFRGWILVAGLALMLPAVALVAGSNGLAKTVPAVGLAPAVAQQSSASQIKASPLMKWIQSIAQAPRLRVIKERLAPLAPALSPSAPPLMLLAPVSITKDASPISGSAVTQGQVIAYTLQSTNGASSDTTVGAGGFIRIIDTAPAGTLFTNVIVQQQPQFGSAWSCSILGGGTSIECHAGDGTGAGVDTFTTQEFVKIRAEVTVQASAVNGTILTNTATYQFDNNGTGLDGSATSNSVFHVVNPPADLGITKVTSNATPTAGGAAFSYTLTVTNNGPSDAKDVLVTDPLPPSVIFQNVAVVGSGSFSCVGPPVGTNGTVTCTSGNLPAAGSATITIVAQITANTASGVRTNTATVVSSTPEATPNVFPNTASAQQNITVNAPLSITKAGPATVCAGDTFTYHITVLNGGSSTALNATISDPLPANTTFLNLSGTGGFETGCSMNGGTPGTVTCAAVDIPTGQSTLDVTVKLAPSAPSGPLANTATITTAGTGTIAVGTSTTTATVNHCSDLEITKTGSPDTVHPGEDINYTITVRNVGPSNIDNIPAGEFVVTDAPFPPSGTTLKGVISAPGFNCNLGVTFPCTATSALAAGATVVIRYTVTVNANFNGGQPGGSVTNTATVNIVGGSNAVDPISANNSSTSNTPVVPSADLSLQKQSFTLAGSAFDAQVTAGGAISAAPPALPVPIVTGQGEVFYALTYRNNGLGDAINVHIRDNLPASAQFVAGSIVVTPAAGPALTCTLSPLPAQLDCTPAGGGTLPAGANGTISFRTRVLANVADGTAIRNTATINSEGIGATPATPDPNGGNNLSNETQNRVRTEANLSIAKSGPASVNAGSNITYTLTVTNNGVSDAQNVVVKDFLPPNVSFVSAASTNNQFVCTPDNGNPGVVTCTAATLIANDPNIVPTRSGSNTATITLVGNVDIRVPNGTVLANNASVSSTTSDPVLANNIVGPINTTVIGNTVPTLSINNVTVTEGTGGTTSANFTVTLSSASVQQVTVDFVTSDGTASNLADYTAQAGTLTFAPGVTTRNIVVPIMTDSFPEPTETFVVTLFNPSNATIGTAQGTGTINDDDASGVFQFSATAANVNENAVPGSINLTINRTGDTSGVASVNFETNDITALQKSDYTFNSGNVQFGPGVTSKTVNVLIVNDALVEGPETFWVSLSNASGNFVVSGNTSIAVTINDDDVAPGANPIDSAGFFVRQQYLDFLGREPDPAGLAFWTNQITLCGADPACILDRRVNVSGAFFLSIEFQETSGNVIRSQRVAFARQSADPATRIHYLQFMRDTRQVGAGVIVGQAGYEAVLEANKQAYAQQIVSSSAFNARFPVSPAATYVDALYASAGVTPTAAERTAAINAFGAGAAPGRIAAFRSVVDSATVRTAEFQSSFVLAEYFGYLRRNPTDAPDFNDAGYQFWLAKLNLFNGDFQKAEMVKAFITSLEYRGRFGTP